MGIEISKRYLDAADLILFCRDEEHDALPDVGAKPVVEVVTKGDLPNRPSAHPPIRPSVSVVTGQGLPELRRRLAEVAFGKLLALGDVEPVVTRARHRAALERAQAELDAFWSARAGGIDAAATATHLRTAVLALDELIGAVTPEDVLDRVFAAFCVGK
jgi:tRNA modification GTPase